MTQPTTAPPLLEIFHTLLLVAALILAAHAAEGGHQLFALLPGIALLLACTMAGYIIARLLPTRLPEIFWVSVVATLAGFPGVPFADLYLAQLSKLSLAAVITPVMAFAALGLGSGDIALFRRLGARIILVSLLVFFGTYLGSVAVANAVLAALPSQG
ncbi:MAG: hypothetical protein AAGI11_14260 [Pseudomonadota bacterium]